MNSSIANLGKSSVHANYNIEDNATKKKRNSNLIACPQNLYFPFKVDFHLYTRKAMNGVSRVKVNV